LPSTSSRQRKESDDVRFRNMPCMSCIPFPPDPLQAGRVGRWEGGPIMDTARASLEIQCAIAIGFIFAVLVITTAIDLWHAGPGNA
jgi:hypothetical protein